jgi:hypothetical protein
MTYAPTRSVGCALRTLLCEPDWFFNEPRRREEREGREKKEGLKSLLRTKTIR